MQFVFPFLKRWPKFVRFLRSIHFYFPLFENELLPQFVVVIQGIFSSVFAIFCLILLFDQMKNIWLDRTYIEESYDTTKRKKV